VIEQQVRDVLQLVVTRVLAQVQDFRHGIVPTPIYGQAPLSPIRWTVHNDPKGGGRDLFQ
jgi:hypothetical protein